jgi:hypothetical protein
MAQGSFQPTLSFSQMLLVCSKTLPPDDVGNGVVRSGDGSGVSDVGRHKNLPQVMIFKTKRLS